MSLKDLFEQQYNVIREAIFADDFIILRHSKGNVRKFDSSGVEHLDVHVA